MNTQTKLTKVELKTRGWTDKAIEIFLGEPDETKRNPCYWNAPPMKLWNEGRVEAIEKSEAFIQWQERNSKRRESASKSASKIVETKKRNLINSIESIEINLPDFEPIILIEMACNHYNEQKLKFLVERNKFEDAGYFELEEKGASLASPTDFLKRITYNFIRHELVSVYDLKLSEISKKVGRPQAYDLLRERVLAHAKEKYPWLESEDFWKNFR